MMSRLLRRLRRSLPWNKRALRAQNQIEHAENSLKHAEAVNRLVHEHTATIRAEVELNDWTRTAKRIFSGRD